MSAPEAHLGGVPVLVVEDDNDSRELFVCALQTCGATVAAAASAREAVELFQLLHPRVIVSDISMPGEDGYWLAARITELAAAGKPILLAVTAHGQQHGRDKALSAGFHDYLTKPVDPSTLCHTLEELIESRR